jgi:methionyl-tRNA formyltransferase
MANSMNSYLDCATEAERQQMMMQQQMAEMAFMQQMQALAPDMSVVVAYGHIHPKAVIDLPPHGTLNIHASLLPELRGAAPIQASILQGLPEQGLG